MFVRVTCKNCDETDYIRVKTRKEAKRIKRTSKNGGVLCRECMGYGTFLLWE